jgi:hypothetical protein
MTPLQFLMLTFGGWVNRHWQAVIDHLREENRVLREQLGGRRIGLYLKKVFSTLACRWYPDSFFHRRRPISLTLMIVQSRTLDRALRRCDRRVGVERGAQIR